MKLTAVSHKQCWQDGRGQWFSSGGFPAQMAAIGSLFDEVTLVVMRGAPREGGSPLPAGAQVVALPALKGEDGTRKAQLISRLPLYLKQISGPLREADVVHVPMPGDIPLAGFLLAYGMRKRLLARYCSSWESNRQTTRSRKLTKAMLRSTAGGRTVALATGLGSRPPAKNMHWVFSTAVTRAEVQAVQPDLTRPAHTPLRVATVSRLVAGKGITDLIRAAGLLGEAAGRIELTIIGDGPQRPELEALARELGLEDRVHFTGLLPHNEVLDRLLEMDLGVFPSLTESFGKARVEAMVCGVPLITTETGFGKELVGEHGERGWLVPYRDPAAIAGIFTRILDGQQDLPALRSCCRQFAAGFTLERWAQDIGKICAGQWGMRLVGGKLVL